MPAGADASAVLFLQGPIGPFFGRLIAALRAEGIAAYKINLNGGDSFYAWDWATDYRDGHDRWRDFLGSYIKRHGITAICVYGDCRDYHQTAREIAREQGIGFYAFEEGYIRPNHLTFEQDGVNGYSGINATALQRWAHKEIEPEMVIKGHMSHRIVYGMFYYMAIFLKRRRFGAYCHHRSTCLFTEAWHWWLAFERRTLYRVTQRHLLNDIIDQFDGRYFLLPLQVCNDSQIRYHSPYDSIEQCIIQVMVSFSSHAHEQDALVIKHHPQDRGHSHYGRLIFEIAHGLGIANRVFYCHDLHLPKLLNHAKGVVTINSTTALSAFFHGAPVKVLGNAFYNIPGLCCQLSLDEFWCSPEKPDRELFLLLRNYLAHHGQINGSFYRCYGPTIRNLIDEMKLRGIVNPRPLQEHKSSDETSLPGTPQPL